MKKTSSNAEASLQACIDYLTPLDKVLVAFSGGVDSTLLINLAKKALPDGAFALSLKNPLIHDFEIEYAIEETERIGIPHFILEFSPLALVKLRLNPPDRCYHCKLEIFGVILKKAKKLGIEHVMDGTNADDVGDYRPGMRALSELGIKSPFLELGIGKEEIREMSRVLGISGAERSPLACLATRFPYNETITPEKIDRIKKAELILRGHGFKTFRVRYLGKALNMVKIEVGVSELSRLLSPDLLGNINSDIKRLGFSSVTLDLGGYRPGSMNEGLKELDDEKP